MAINKRKLKTLSIKEKACAIKAVEQGKKKSVVAKQFGIPPSTLSTYLKNKDFILKYANDQWVSERKRMRNCEYPLIEKCLSKWYMQCKEKNIPIDGNLIREKAQEFGYKLAETDFQASNGWLDKFKKRHGILFNKVCGRGAEIKKEVSTDWLQKLPEIIRNYKPDDIFSADEAFLSYKCTPDEMMYFIGDKNKRRKIRKERITLFLGSNMSGTEKLPPIFVGKTLKPQCFKNVRTLPLQYEANEKACMTSDIFSNWLKRLDENMDRRKRKIILFIDSCTAHFAIPNLKAVKLQFLPLDTTSRLHPMRQGIIRNFKFHYRKHVVRKLLHDIEEGKLLGINLLEGIRMVHRAWNQVTRSTIAKCFREAGFVQDNTSDIDEDHPSNEDEYIYDDWDNLTKAIGDETLLFQDFVNVDDDEDFYGHLSDDDIIIEAQSELVKEESEEEEDETKLTETRVPSCEEASNALAVLREFLEATPNLERSVFQAINIIEDVIESKSSQHCRQTNMRYFFQ